MLVPSNAGDWGELPTLTAISMLPLESSFFSMWSPLSVNQMFAPSKMIPRGLSNEFGLERPIIGE